MVVVIDGSAADRPALAWGAEEASQLGRSLLISLAVGHLSPGLGYAERRIAGDQRRAVGRQIVDDAAAWVSREVPHLPVETAVRLLEPTALLALVGRRAHAMVRADRAWVGARAPWGPVVAAVSDSERDARVLEYAADYANRRRVDLVVVDTNGWDDQGAAPANATLVLTAGPGSEPSHDRARRSWEVTARTAARFRKPLVLVAGTAINSGGPGGRTPTLSPWSTDPPPVTPRDCGSTSS
jgi:hypothetical protein